MNQYFFCKNNHLECYIISKSDNNNNNNKQNLKAQRNSIRLLNQILISINKYGQKKVNKTHTLENIASRTSSINIYKSFFRLHLNYRDMIYDIKHAILLLYNAAAAQWVNPCTTMQVTLDSPQRSCLHISSFSLTNKPTQSSILPRSEYQIVPGLTLGHPR